MKILAALFAGFMMLSFQFVSSTEKKAYAETLDHVNIYEAKKDESLLQIGMKHGVSEIELKKINHVTANEIETGEKLIIPRSISEEDKDLLARLVHAEAKGEPYKGKVAVALVVLNRVEDKRFPDTIKEVIYEKNQFQPVDNGSIYEPADEEAKRAVMEALARQGQWKQSVYFFNPEKTGDSWLRTKKVTAVIGNHRFAK